MSVRRIMGTETEYGISVPGDPSANPMTTSSQVVNAYARTQPRQQARWDFEEEHPLRDARGFDLGRDRADASLLTDTETTLANVILTNGARLYVDHAHPEYSAPETTNPRDALIWDKAGDRIMLAGARRAYEVPGTPRLNLYKNNVDNKGASYGAHENYLMRRQTPFGAITSGLIPFLVSRPVVAGAGRVGLGQDGRRAGFQISQRADYVEVEVGLETTLKRPIVNTRDEPHADADTYRRLHVIIGDANLSETSAYLKLGTTALVLAMIEDDWLPGDLAVDHPVAALHAVSHDASCRDLLTLVDGRRLTAVELQTEYCRLARKYTDDRLGSDADPVTLDVLDRWEDCLDLLADDPMRLADRLDWVAKLQLLRSYRDRDGLAWDDPKLALIDLQYADLRPDKSLYERLVSSGRMRRIITDEEITAAIDDPPTDTRAYFRGRCMRDFAAQIAAASWDSVVFDLPGRDALQRIPTIDPLRGTRRHVGELMDRCDTAVQLVDTITGAAG